MALAERKETKDYLGIYSTSDYKLVNVTFRQAYYFESFKAFQT